MRFIILATTSWRAVSFVVLLQVRLSLKPPPPKKKKNTSRKKANISSTYIHSIYFSPNYNHLLFLQWDMPRENGRAYWENMMQFWYMIRCIYFSELYEFLAILKPRYSSVQIVVFSWFSLYIIKYKVGQTCCNVTFYLSLRKIVTYTKTFTYFTKRLVTVSVSSSPAHASLDFPF